MVVFLTVPIHAILLLSRDFAIGNDLKLSTKANHLHPLAFHRARTHVTNPTRRACKSEGNQESKSPRCVR